MHRDVGVQILIRMKLCRLLLTEQKPKEFLPMCQCFSSTRTKILSGRGSPGPKVGLRSEIKKTCLVHQFSCGIIDVKKGGPRVSVLFFSFSLFLFSLFLCSSLFLSFFLLSFLLF